MDDTFPSVVAIALVDLHYQHGLSVPGIDQRHPAPSCGWPVPAAERTLDSARMLTECSARN